MFLEGKEVYEGNPTLLSKKNIHVYHKTILYE